MTTVDRRDSGQHTARSQHSEGSQHSARSQHSEGGGHGGQVDRAGRGGDRGLADLAARCVAVLGGDLAAYVSGARTPDELAVLARSGAAVPGAVQPGLVKERLGAVLDVVDAFAAANRVGMVRAWLRETGAAGPGMAPAAVLRHSREHGARKRVYEAAEQFLAGPLPAR